MRLFDSQGNAISLGDRLAQGGEGTVFRLPDQPALVAKIYHKPPSSERVAKLRTMATLKSSELAKLACWPVDLLADRKGGSVRGFLMPNAGGYKEAHKLYSPKSRAVEFKSVDWRFLINASANIARAFAVVHAQGQVIGDVNHSSVMVAPDSTVRLIDCDSFQIQLGGKRYPCEAAEPLHRAPELFGQTVSQVVHTPNHDNFGLAVLIFELLFMGRHPFAGAYLGTGELSLEQKIAGFMFAYGAGAPSRQVKQPPNTLPLAAVSGRVAAMFESAFGPEGLKGRPTAAQWVAALGRLQGELKPCAKDPAHYYHRDLPSCPWCEIERNVGTPLFNLAFTPVPTSAGAFNLALVWESIARVTPPSSLLAPDVSNLPLRPAGQRFVLAGKKRRKTARSGAMLGILIIALSFFAVQLILVGFCVGFIVWGLMASIAKSDSRRIRQEAAENLDKASGRLDRLLKEWDATASTELFSSLYRELEAKRNQYRDLPEYHQRELARLESTRRESQLHRFLDTHRIRPGLISGIGVGRCRTLSSYGIETAADLSFLSIYAVPGFGASHAEKLMQWRQSLEQTFVFDPNQGVDPADRRKLESEVMAKRSDLERDLLAGPSMLKGTVSRIENARGTLVASLEIAKRNLAQAEADFAAV